MNYRVLGKTGYKISEVSLGTWQLSCRWGEPFNDQEADRTLNAAYDAGINFIDTADLYNDGNSEKAIGRFLKGKQDKVFVATKLGREIRPVTAESYTKENLTRYVEQSLKRMDLEVLDLIQFHTPDRKSVV